MRAEGRHATLLWSGLPTAPRFRPQVSSSSKEETYGR
jgi:hypothetical protein